MFSINRGTIMTNPFKTTFRLGINGLIKTYIGQQQLSGAYEEDIGECFYVFETLASMCEVSDDEMKPALPIIPKVDAFSLFHYRQ